MAETTVSQAEKKKNRFRFPLWQALARQSGGAVVFDSGAQFAAAAFLPLCPGCRIQKSPSTQELLEDRFSLPYLFLSGYCAGPW